MFGPGKSLQPGDVPPKNFPRLDQDAIFDIDRSTLVLQLRTLRRAINEAAEEMEMVAIERVFVKSLSRAITRGAQKLYLASEDLDNILGLVQRAHVPKATGRSRSNSKQASRRKARSNLDRNNRL